jgi:hypothetical protein
MRPQRLVLGCFTLCVASIIVACGGSKSGPAGPETPRVLQGQTVSAIDGSASGVVSVQIGSRLPVQTDTSGNFQVDVGAPGTYSAVVTGSSFVERRTMVTGPSTERARLGIIPASYDLKAFNEMFRGANSRLQRWTTQPSLVIVASVMKYANNAEQFSATAEQLTDDEVASLTSDLKNALSLLTAGTFTTFGSVDVERPASGDQVGVRRTGKIVIGRYTGITTLANTIGYGSWAEQGDGTVVGGSVWLDRDFDKGDPRRWLLRTHELGHALGYNHVTVRTSIMNPAIGPEPNDFDRAGAAIAFQRPVGNVSPDTDPSAAPRTFSISEGGARWRAPIE